MPKLRAAIACLCVSVSTPSLAAVKPAEIQPYISAAAPYGSGSYTALLSTIYDADLWTDAPHWSWNEVFALSLHYHMDIEGPTLSEKSIKVMNDMSPLSPDQAIDYRWQLTKIFPDVKDGDNITAIYIPTKGLLFYHNDVSIGAINNLAFARRFLSIWFSEYTPAPKLRHQLLGDVAQAQN